MKRNVALTVLYIASMLAAFVACTPAEQQQAAQGAESTEKAVHAVATICQSIAALSGVPELAEKCKNVHDATKFIQQNIPLSCDLPTDAGGQ